MSPASLRRGLRAREYLLEPTNHRSGRRVGTLLASVVAGDEAASHKLALILPAFNTVADGLLDEARQAFVLAQDIFCGPAQIRVDPQGRVAGRFHRRPRALQLQRILPDRSAACNRLACSRPATSAQADAGSA